MSIITNLKSQLKTTTISWLKEALLYLEPTAFTPPAPHSDAEILAKYSSELNPNKDAVLEKLLTNTFRGIHNSISPQQNNKVLAKLLMPCTAKIHHKLDTLGKIIAIQPMGGPVDQIPTFVAKVDPFTNNIAVQILREVVEARTRRLSAKFTMELSDTNTQDVNIDMEKMFIETIASEVVNEIEDTIIVQLRNGAKPVLLPNIGTLQNSSAAEKLILEILTEAQNVKLRSNRQEANFCIVDDQTLELLKQDTKGLFQATVVGNDSSIFKEVGTIARSITVYVSRVMNNRQILLGYKGNDNTLSSEMRTMDAGFFYCPYQIVTSSGIVVDPQTYEPILSLMTRYGTFGGVGLERIERYYTLVTY